MNDIYLDHGATTPVHPQVFEKMTPFLQERFGNPSSLHFKGKIAKIPIEDARVYVAKALHTHPTRIVFTSGGTESDYTAIVGAALAQREKGKHIIISEIEHSAVFEAVDFLKQFDFEITYLPVNSQGIVEIDQLKQAIRNDTILISVMYVNNELGTIQPIQQIGDIAREKGILFHTDAVQAFPVMGIDVSTLPVDLLTVSSHKINGPKGVGALYIHKDVKIRPLIGGNQERNRRGGTENVPGIVGFGEAAKILTETREEKWQKAQQFKNRMIKIWKEKLGEEEFFINGDLHGVPSILNVSFPSVDTQTMIVSLDMKKIAISGGSACAAGSIDVTRVIKALHLPDPIAKSAIRISFGYGNTLEDIERAAKEIVNIVNRKRK